jgi:hypothetical protein
MKLFSLRSLLCFLFLGCCQSAEALAGAAAAILKDHSSAAVGLFNNMRTPAALIGGSLVPLGIMTAPTINKDDSKMTKYLKKANMIVSALSLLSEILAVTYSSIAINKLVEIPSPATAGVAQLIAQNHELAWIGTNVHFLLGMLGFGLIVGARAYFNFGNRVGKIALGWSVAAFLQAVSIVNRGIAMGGGPSDSSKFASNLFGLILRYVSLSFRNARGGVCATAALAVAAFATFHTVKIFLGGDEKE